MSRNRSILLGLGITVALALSAPGVRAQVVTASAHAPMVAGALAVPPGGFLGYCVAHRRDCTARDPMPSTVELTAERLHELEAVQAAVNGRVRPRENPAHAWEYAVDGYGDCNTFALEKRRALLERGWPVSALLLTSAVTETGEGHLVLVVRTSGGDLVLDNRLAPVVDWRRLPYRWVSRQSERNPLVWVAVPAGPAFISDAGFDGTTGHGRKEGKS